MKKYVTPEISTIDIGKAIVDDKEVEVVGVIPFLAAVAGAAAAAMSAVGAATQAKQTYKDGYGFTENNPINSLDKVEE